MSLQDSFGGNLRPMMHLDAHVPFFNGVSLTYNTYSVLFVSIQTSPYIQRLQIYVNHAVTFLAVAMSR